MMSQMFGTPAYAIYRASPVYCQITDALISTAYVPIKIGYSEEFLWMAYRDLNEIETQWLEGNHDPDVFFKVAPVGKPSEYAPVPAGHEWEEIPF